VGRERDPRTSGHGEQGSLAGKHHATSSESHDPVSFCGCGATVTRQVVTNAARCDTARCDGFLSDSTTFGKTRPTRGKPTTVGRVPKNKHRSSKRPPRRSGHPALRSARRHPEDDWDLLDEVEVALTADHPLTMLQTASAVLNIVDSRNDHLLDPSAKRENVSLPDLLNALIAATGNMILANAGNLPPYCNGQELDVESGLPLGMTPDVCYSESTFQLNPNDRLTFVSDGVVEATNERGELFGFQRTQGISTQPASAIAEAAKKFGQHDDITVLTLTLTPSLAASLA